MVWSTDTARIELSPEQYRHLTTALQTGESFEQTWRKAYDYLLKTCHESDNYERFYRKLQDDFKMGLAGNVGVMEVLSGGLTFSLSNDFNSLKEGEKRNIEKFYSEIKESHMDEGTLKQATYLNFTGEDYRAGAKPKSLKLCRISSTQLSREIINSAVDMHTVGLANVASNFEYNLSEASDAYGTRYEVIPVTIDVRSPKYQPMSDSPNHFRIEPGSNFDIIVKSRLLNRKVHATWITPALYGSHFYDTFETNTLIVMHGDNNIRLKGETKGAANSTIVLYVHIMYAN